MLIVYVSAYARRLRISLIAALLFTTLATPIAAYAAKGDPEKVEPAKPLAEFELTDHNGLKFGKDQFTGKWSLVLLGFTQCPDICPFTLQNLTQVVEQLTLRARPDRLPQVVFVGVDPDRDKPVLGEYVKAFSPGFVGVSGEWAEITRVVESLEGYVRLDKKAPDATDYQVFHSAYVTVIDPEGRLAARLSPPMEPNATALFLAMLMREYAKAIN
jgi:protein SCO1/2